MKKEEKARFLDYIWLFIIGGLFGFMIETIWYYIKHQILIFKFGLIYTPLKPIYGLGFMIIVFIMQKCKKNKIWQQFLIGVAIGTIYEYCASLFQEFVFGTSTWDYSTFNFNIMGRIYLPYCLIWGIIAVLCIHYLFPFIKRIIQKVPHKIYNVITIIVAILICIDVSLTTLATIRYSQRSNMQETNNYIMEFIDKKYPDSYMKKRFPKLKIVKNVKK